MGLATRMTQEERATLKARIDQATRSRALLQESRGLPPTERQLQVLRLIADGYSNPEVAEAMGLHEETVKHHLKRVYARFGSRSRAQAVATAIRQGWIE